MAISLRPPRKSIRTPTIPGSLNSRSATQAKPADCSLPPTTRSSSPKKGHKNVHHGDTQARRRFKNQIANLLPPPQLVACQSETLNLRSSISPYLRGEIHNPR